MESAGIQGGSAARRRRIRREGPFRCERETFSFWLDGIRPGFGEAFAAIFDAQLTKTESGSDLNALSHLYAYKKKLPQLLDSLQLKLYWQMILEGATRDTASLIFAVVRKLNIDAAANDGVEPVLLNIPDRPLESTIKKRFRNAATFERSVSVQGPCVGTAVSEWLDRLAPGMSDRFATAFVELRIAYTSELEAALQTGSNLSRLHLVSRLRRTLRSRGATDHDVRAILRAARKLNDRERQVTELLHPYTAAVVYVVPGSEIRHSNIPDFVEEYNSRHGIQKVEVANYPVGHGAHVKEKLKEYEAFQKYCQEGRRVAELHRKVIWTKTALVGYRDPYFESIVGQPVMPELAVFPGEFPRATAELAEPTGLVRILEHNELPREHQAPLAYPELTTAFPSTISMFAVAPPRSSPELSWGGTVDQTPMLTHLNSSGPGAISPLMAVDHTAKAVIAGPFEPASKGTKKGSSVARPALQHYLLQPRQVEPGDPFEFIESYARKTAATASRSEASSSSGGPGARRAVPGSINPALFQFLLGTVDAGSPLSVLRGNNIVIEKIWLAMLDLCVDELVFDGLSYATIKHRAEFPTPAGRFCNMMPVDLEHPERLPSEFKGYWPLVEACVRTFATDTRHPNYEDDEGTGYYETDEAMREGRSIVYLTVDEREVSPGTTQRRGGLHTEAPGTRLRGSTGLDQMHPPVFHGWGIGHMVKQRSFAGGLYMCSSVDRSAAVYDARVKRPCTDAEGRLCDGETTVIGALGDCEHLRPCVQHTRRKLGANELVWMTDTTLHESLPVPNGGPRQFFRLVTSRIGAWYEEHNTPNPFGVVPPSYVPVISGSKFG